MNPVYSSRPAIRRPAPFSPLLALALTLALLWFATVRTGAATNDNFSGRPTIAGTQFNFLSSNVGASAEPNEPNHAGHAGGQSVWWSWTPTNSGNVTVTMNTGFGFNALMAFYRGTALTNLTPVASVANTNGDYEISVSFDITAGLRYEVVIDSVDSPGEGPISMYTTAFVPQPANDNFSQRAISTAPFFSGSGSFIAATVEPGEGNHGAPTNNYGSVWWSWTAPDVVGSLLPLATVTATGPMEAPRLRVYQGYSVSNLTAVSGLELVAGNTRQFVFPVDPAATYQFAVVGIKSDDSGTFVSPTFANFDLLFNYSLLNLGITNVSRTTNTSARTTSFAAQARIQNAGFEPTHPLRVRLLAKAGYSRNDGSQSSPLPPDVALGTFVPTEGHAEPGETLIVPINGVTPPADPDDNFYAAGWGIFAILEEQVGTDWFLADKKLAMFGFWPNVGGFSGPGGGVVRIDPGLGSDTFNPISLTNLVISGTNTLREGDSATYTASAAFSNGTNQPVIPRWTASRFTISSNGVFQSGPVASNSVINVNGFYTMNGSSLSATKAVLVTNVFVPAAFSSNSAARSGATTFSVELTGSPGDRYILEGTEDFANWTSVSTNFAAANGAVTVTDPNATNAYRFYRTRRVE